MSDVYTDEIVLEVISCSIHEAFKLKSIGRERKLMMEFNGDGTVIL